MGIKRAKMDQEYDAFISFSKADRDFAIRLASRLVDAGFSVFFDEAQLEAGDSLLYL